MENKMRQKQDLIIKELIQNKNNVTEACAKHNVGRTTYYEWMKDPDFKERLNEAEDAMLDWIESQAKKRIEEGSDKLIELYLKTRGKKRGFVEDKNIDINHTFFKIEHEPEDESGDNKGS
jgi:transposase-like protein